MDFVALFIVTFLLGFIAALTYYSYIKLVEIEFNTQKSVDKARVMGSQLEHINGRLGDIYSELRNRHPQAKRGRPPKERK